MKLVGAPASECLLALRAIFGDDTECEPIAPDMQAIRDALRTPPLPVLRFAPADLEWGGWRFVEEAGEQFLAHRRRGNGLVDYVCYVPLGDVRIAADLDRWIRHVRGRSNMASADKGAFEDALLACWEIRSA